MTIKHEAIPEDMYKEHILELYKSPRNIGELKGKTNEATAYNANCGDEITMQFIIKNDKVQDVKFSGSGCVISQVSASLLTDKFKGLSVDKVKKFQPEEVLKMLNLKLNPARVRCALISLEAAKKALK